MLLNILRAPNATCFIVHTIVNAMTKTFQGTIKHNTRESAIIFPDNKKQTLNKIWFIAEMRLPKRNNILHHESFGNCASNVNRDSCMSLFSTWPACLSCLQPYTVCCVRPMKNALVILCFEQVTWPELDWV